MNNKVRILIWLAALLFFIAGVFYGRVSGATEELPISLDLTKMETADFAGTEFYQLKRGHLVLVVSTDPTNDAAKWLKRHVGEKIVVTLSGRD